MRIYQAFILGILRGATEFLPISSSGHLILLPSLLGWEIQSLAFDAILHLGTVAALIIYFWKDILEVLKSKKHMLLIGVGLIPAIVVGVLFEGVIETYLRSPQYVAFFLIFGSVIIFTAERTYKNVWHEERLGDTDKLELKNGFMIGLFQALALLPGVSRSGSTISGGIFAGLSREASARFSFILSIPIVIGAGLFKMVDSYQHSSFDFVLLAGFLGSLITGVICIKWLLNFLKKNTLMPFVVYRLVLVGLIILFLI